MFVCLVVLGFFFLPQAVPIQLCQRKGVVGGAALSENRTHKGKMLSCSRYFLISEVSDVLEKEILFLISEVFLLIEFCCYNNDFISIALFHVKHAQLR